MTGFDETLPEAMATRGEERMGSLERPRDAPDGRPVVLASTFDFGNAIGIQGYCRLVKQRFAIMLDVADAVTLVDQINDAIRRAAEKRS